MAAAKKTAAKKAAMPIKKAMPKGATKKAGKKAMPSMPKFAGPTGSFSGGSTRGSEGGEG